jgi:hypothetical protein
MTLIVSPYRRHADGSLEWLSVPSPHTDLAGVEASRHTFWNASATEPLGLSLVRTLASADVYAEGPDLELLAREVEQLRSHLSLFPGEEEYWSVRLDNVRSAIGVAFSLPLGQGGVYIG